MGDLDKYSMFHPAGDHARQQKKQAEMMTCPAGHPLTDDNLHVGVDNTGRLRRRCLKCAQERIDARKQESFEERFGAYLD